MDGTQASCLGWHAWGKQACPLEAGGPRSCSLVSCCACGGPGLRETVCIKQKLNPISALLYTVSNV